MPRNVTLLELVNAVAEHTRSEAELIATVAYMVNRGHVRLCGNFKGQRFALSTLTAARLGARPARSPGGFDCCRVR